ncbi:hypothetical protein [Rhizobium sp. 18065]|uniref:hypothetical protein n=1 Tax=Rhizobium sp. 18065 TaxID=2681411 RepID=UPI0013594BF9|nr:hypothetical protein [Rhizobium sp. 18065]
MNLKMIRFLSRLRSKQRDLRGQIKRLRKAYDALDKYCEYLLGRVRRLEVDNEELRKEAAWKPPAKD